VTDVWGGGTKGSSWLDMKDPTPWAVGAPCSQTDANLFHPPPGCSGVEAKRICWGSCTDREACLKYAMDEDITEGVWGGATARDRWKLRRGIPVVLEPPAREPKRRVGEPKVYDHVCESCGGEFRGHPHAKFCSRTCKARVERARRNQARRKDAA
jgi:WhiB family redox-sensing transcriptional regulator